MTYAIVSGGRGRVVAILTKGCAKVHHYYHQPQFIPTANDTRPNRYWEEAKQNLRY